MTWLYGQHYIIRNFTPNKCSTLYFEGKPLIFIYPNLKITLLLVTLLISYKIEVRLLDLTFKALDDLSQQTSSHNSLVSDSCGVSVSTTGCASAKEEEAGVWDGFMSKKEGRMEDKTGQGLSPFFSRSKPLVETPQARVCAHGGEQGRGLWGST